MNFDCVYIIGISIPTENKAFRFTEFHTLELLVLQMFFETPSVHYYCDINQYKFLFVSVSVNMSLSPPKKFKV